MPVGARSTHFSRTGNLCILSLDGSVGHRPTHPRAKRGIGLHSGHGAVTGVCAFERDDGWATLHSCETWYYSNSQTFITHWLNRDHIHRCCRRQSVGTGPGRNAGHPWLRRMGAEPGFCPPPQDPSYPFKAVPRSRLPVSCPVRYLHSIIDYAPTIPCVAGAFTGGVVRTLLDIDLNRMVEVGRRPRGP